MNITNYEKLVLCAAINDRNTIYQLSRELNEDCFWKGPGGIAHKLIYRAILSLLQDNKPVDVATIAKALGKDSELVGGRHTSQRSARLCL